MKRAGTLGKGRTAWEGEPNSPAGLWTPLLVQLSLCCLWGAGLQLQLDLHPSPVLLSSAEFK